MSENLLTRWLKAKKGKLRDVPVQIGQMVFHVPHDGSNYLLFKCRKCGACCRGQRWEALLLTEGDVKRLTKALGYSSMKEFMDKECILAEVTEPKEVYPLIGGPPVKARYAGFYLKRFKGENRRTVLKPHACRFVTEDNLCSIYEARPIVCRRFPYTTYRNQQGLTDAYYVDVPFSTCQGYREKRHIKKQWLTPWVKDLLEGDREILESVQSGFFMITEMEK
jgi:Fe-S-cluster containining protein